MAIKSQTQKQSQAMMTAAACQREKFVAPPVASALSVPEAVPIL